MNREQLINEIHDRIISDYIRQNAIYDRDNNTIEYIRETELVHKETGNIEVKSSVYNVNVKYIDETINDVLDIDNDIKAIYELGITHKNANEFKKEIIQNHPDLIETFKEYYLTYPDCDKLYPDISKDLRDMVNKYDAWNNLVIKGKVQLDDDIDSYYRLDDIGKLYERLYRLIRLEEISAPEIIIKNELVLVSKAILDLDNFKTFDKQIIKYEDFTKDEESIEKE